MINIGIVPRYSFERLPGTTKYYITPMKCFCDIPLGMIKNHMQRYGYYGIGFKKSFLQRHGATPVIYIHKNSEHFFGFKKMKVLDLDQKLFLPLLKRYYGSDYFFDDELGIVEPRRIRFYDEKEWRFLPKNVTLEILEEFPTIQEGLEFVRIKNSTNPFSTTPIKPSINDIEYVIIHKKKELPEIIKQLRSIFSNSDDADLMITKIIIAEQILKDY
jgi:hypothetical protein